LLGLPELRQRYLAHMRTVLREFYNPSVMDPIVEHYRALSIADITVDPKKNFSMAQYTNDLIALKSFVQRRHVYLTNSVELRSMAPSILAVPEPIPPSAGKIPWITARVAANENDGIDSVWLYFRNQSYGRFGTVQMFDDGKHGDGAVNDGVFGAATTNYPAGTKVRYYVEARSANTAKSASFAPARAEQETFSYRVTAPVAASTAIVINEFMASNSKTLTDPQGEYDDWIELWNISAAEIDLSGFYLSDDPDKPRKWSFPAGTRIPADGYLIVWADEDGAAAAGLHVNFKLSATGEQILLSDTDARRNALLDSITFGAQETDRSYGRSAADAKVFQTMAPTPGTPNN
jgi:hypothetical protein